MNSNISITTLDSGLESSYRTFVESADNALIYHSLAYRDFIKDLLNVTPLYRVAVDTHRNIHGILPLAKCQGSLGTVLNALPFYGANGGFLTDSPNTLTLLKQDYKALVNNLDIVSSTIISNPLDILDYSDVAADLRDERIGQFTSLPNLSEADDKTISEALMSRYHQKTRNMVRKAEKLGISITVEDHKAVDFLEKIHNENMNALGVTPKPKEFFKLFQLHFQHGRDWNIYTAKHDGNRIAAMLVFYFKKITEYYVPAISEPHRDKQGLSLIIHKAMCDSVRLGHQWWNWGGTRGSMHGVYRFKSRWGAEDRPYAFYTAIRDQKILLQSAEVLSQSYPHVFVAPFSALK